MPVCWCLYLCPCPCLSLPTVHCLCSPRVGSGLVWSGLVWSDLDGSGSGSALLLHYCRPAGSTAPLTACTTCACFGASWEDHLQSRLAIGLGESGLCGGDPARERPRLARDPDNIDRRTPSTRSAGRGLVHRNNNYEDGLRRGEWQAGRVILSVRRARGSVRPVRLKPANQSASQPATGHGP